MERKRVHLQINGNVQGVFFRISTRDQARQLGLMGWVRNLADGSVEAVAEGTEDDLTRLISWCETGPPGAKVHRVKPRWEEPKGKYTGFNVRH